MARRVILAVTAAALLAGAGVSEAANGKQRVVVERFADDFSGVAIDCGDVGPYDFSILVEGTIRGTVTEVLAGDGSLLQTVFHFVLDETDTNSVSGRSLPLHGVKHEVWDYSSNTRTVSGSAYIGTEPGEGTYMLDAGRITMTLDTRVPQSVAGHHEVFFGGGIDPFMCAALAGS